jgi:hypothetical protein
MLNPEQIQLVSTAVRELRVALSNFFLYSEENAMVQQSLDRFLVNLNKLFATVPSISLGESEGRLVVEGAPLDERSTGSLNMIKDLFMVQKIQSLAFLKGIQAAELKTFFGLLRPKTLSAGQSLAQALETKKLPHLKLNEKVFVAIKEGEKVVSGASALAGPEALGGEENLQEALEALQYFLQIFERVRPETNKKEVGQKLMEHLGDWLKGENLLNLPASSGGAPASAASPKSISNWQKMLEGFLNLKKTLAVAKEPQQVKTAQLSLDDLLKRLVFLGEGQGLGAGEAGISIASGTSDQQPVLFELDPVFDKLQSGQLEVLADPSLEGPVGDALLRLQGEAFQAVWDGIWKNIFSGDEKIQSQGLRHLNRLQWDRMSRPLQLAGFQNLRHFLAGEPSASGYFVALSLVQNWLPLELNKPSWEEVVAMTQTLGVLAKRNPPLFDRQDEAARATLSAIFYPPALESLYGAEASGESEKGLKTRLFSTLASLTAPFLMDKVQRHSPDSDDWKKAVDLLSQIETAGIPVYERWISRHDSPEEWAAFLGMFDRVNFSPALADYLEKNWNTLTLENRLKIITLVGRWRRTDFHPLVLELLHGISPELALAALKTLPRIAMEGDSRKVISELKNYALDSPAREPFWLETCKTLGGLAEPYALSDLMEWAGKYKFLENKKERSSAVRLAALEALGHFKSDRVAAFLSKLQEEEREMRPAVQEVLEKVLKRIQEGGGTIESNGSSANSTGENAAQDFME